MTEEFNKTKLLKGNIIFTETPEKFTIMKDSYIVLIDGKIKEISNELGDKYDKSLVVDYGNKLIIPGMNDLHLHAPQYKNIGIGMDKELIPWLNSYTFPEESRFKDLTYAKTVYKKVIKELWRQGTTAAALFSTIHKEGTKLLIDLLDKAGLYAFVGKVNMDINSPEYLIENTEESIKDTEEVLTYCKGKSTLVKPIITPRFVPSCSKELMDKLGDLAIKNNLPVQSHLSENIEEISWVKDLHQDSKFYGDVYNTYNLFGQTPTLMAHCIHSSDEELELIKKNNVMVVHCPISNVNIGSGIMPCRKYLDKGISLALGSDVSGGSSYSIFKTIAYAIQLSKLQWQQSGKAEKFLSLSEAFYMATKSGGSFFGKIGSFEKDYVFNAIVIDDESLGSEDYSVVERLERFIYLGDDRNILFRYVNGEVVDEPEF
ncbi:MAG: guanine deaminase [Clostridiaceae bacterium]